MVYRGSRPREAKSFVKRDISTPDSKWRRHRNKKRIWRRAVKRFELTVILAQTTETAPFGAVSV